MAIQQFKTAYLQVIRRLLLFLLAAGMTAGCSKKTDPVPDPQPEGPASHTMLLYMPGRSLMTFYNNNIRGIEEAVSARALGDGRVLVCYQPTSHGQAVLFELRYDAKQKTCVREPLKEYAAFNAGSEDSVRELLLDVQQLAPARSYGLMIGCHGSAWAPSDFELSSYALLPDRVPMTRAEQRSEASETDTRAFGDTGYRLEIGELAGIVEQLPFRFNYLIFDACFMANIETLYELRHAFDYVVASPCEIMAAGFPYARAVPYLYASGRADLAAVCQEFWNFYEHDWNSVFNNLQSGCISLAVMSELEALADAAAAIQAGPQRAYEVGELQYYEGMRRHLFYDFGQYMRAICDDDTLYDRFEKQFDRAFPAASRLHTATFYSDFNSVIIPVKSYSGVSTSEPSERDPERYRETDWYRRVHK